MKRIDEIEERFKPGSSEPMYYDSIFPFIPFWAYVIVFLIFMIVFITVGPYWIPDEWLTIFPIIFASFFITYLAGDIIYFYISSPFEKARGEILHHEIVSEGRRRGFARILIYEDGIEIRRAFSRTFIPYVRMEQVELSNSSSVILIKTHLPKVDRIICLSNKNLFYKIEGMRLMLLNKDED